MQTLTTDKVWHSTSKTLYWFKHTDNEKLTIPIKSFRPSDTPSFWIAELHDGTQLSLHYTRIFVTRLDEVPPLV